MFSYIVVPGSERIVLSVTSFHRFPKLNPSFFLFLLSESTKFFPFFTFSASTSLLSLFLPPLSPPHPPHPQAETLTHTHTHFDFLVSLRPVIALSVTSTESFLLFPFFYNVLNSPPSSISSSSSFYLLLLSPPLSSSSFFYLLIILTHADPHTHTKFDFSSLFHILGLSVISNDAGARILICG